MKTSRRCLGVIWGVVSCLAGTGNSAAQESGFRTYDGRQSISGFSERVAPGILALTGHTAGVLGLAFTDRNSLVSIGADSTIRRWKYRPRTPEKPYGFSPQASVVHTSFTPTCLASIPDEQVFAVGGRDGIVRLWENAGLRYSRKLDFSQDVGRGTPPAWQPAGVRALVFSSRKQWLAVGDAGGRVGLFDRKTWELRMLGHFSESIRSLRFAPDDSLLAAVDTKGNLRFWDPRGGAEIDALHAPNLGIAAVAFAPDGRTLGYALDHFRIFDLRTRQQIRQIGQLSTPGRARDSYNLTFSPDGRALATVGDDGLIRIWAAATGSQIAALAGHTGDITALTFSPDGDMLASAGTDQTIRVFDMNIAAPSITVLAQSGPANQPPPMPPSDDVDTPPSTMRHIDSEAYAVVIGVEKYHRAMIPSVEFAARDAQTVANYLTHAMGFDPNNVLLLKDEQASKGDFDKSLGVWLRNRATRKSRILVYYAGHGAPNAETGQPFLVPYDGDPEYIDDTGYALSRLYANLAHLPAQDIRVVLDACFTGQGGRSLIAKGVRPLVTVRDDVSAAGPNTVIITATGDKQISTSYPDGQHGLLTHFLLKGLRGAADSNGNKQIETAELFQYLKPLVEKEALKRNVRQSPTIAPGLDALGEKGRRVWVTIQ